MSLAFLIGTAFGVKSPRDLASDAGRSGGCRL